MNRTKLAVVSTITAVMILGSTIVFASAPAADTADTGADAPSMTTDLQADPNVRRGGGAGHNLKK